MDAAKSQSLPASRRNRKSFELDQRRRDGTYLELSEARYPAEREHAMEQLAQHAEWWRTPLAQRREQIRDLEIEPVFFRIDIQSMSGLRGVPEVE